MSERPKDEPSSFLPPPIANRESARDVHRTEPPRPTSASIAAPAEPRGWPVWPLPVVLVLLVSVILWRSPPKIVRRWIVTGSAARKLEPYVAQLPLVGVRPAIASAPRVCGKVAIIDVDAKRVDESFHELDPSLLPRDASELGTVAAVSCREISIGAYGGMAGANTYLVRCRVDLVDFASRAWLGGLLIDSEDLPAKMRRTGEIHGSRPDLAIARWISSLPRACG